MYLLGYVPIYISKRYMLPNIFFDINCQELRLNMHIDINIVILETITNISLNK